MSGDIVERLRRISGGSSVVELAWDAAHEIERLRAEVDLKGYRLDDALSEIDRLRAERDASRLTISDLTAEVERLRAAGDALAKWLWRGGGDLADMIAAVAAWEEARRER